MGEANSDLESPVNITEDKLTLLIISSIHTLKRNKRKCDRLEVYILVKDRLEVCILVKESVEFKISS